MRSDTESLLNNVVTILCRPRDTINIGIALRAIVNMGMPSLRLVEPYRFDKPTVRIIAPRAASYVDSITVYDTLEASLADLESVFGLTARRRHASWTLLTPEEAAEMAQANLESGKIGFVFGSERTGLTNEELELCTHLVQIPASAHAPVLNLGQSVMVMAYVMHRTVIATGSAGSDDSPRMAAVGEVSFLMALLTELMHRFQFFRSKGPTSAIHTIKNILARTQLTHREARLLIGMVKSALQFLDSNRNP